MILCHNIRNSTPFSIAGRNCPSFRHATAADLVCSDIELKGKLRMYFEKISLDLGEEKERGMQLG
jgi:hypothetical protein